MRHQIDSIWMDICACTKSRHYFIHDHDHDDQCIITIYHFTLVFKLYRILNLPVPPKPDPAVIAVVVPASLGLKGESLPSLETLVISGLAELARGDANCALELRGEDPRSRVVSLACVSRVSNGEECIRSFRIANMEPAKFSIFVVLLWPSCGVLIADDICAEESAIVDAEPTGASPSVVRC